MQPRENRETYLEQREASAALPRVGTTRGTSATPRFIVSENLNAYSQANTPVNSLAGKAPMLVTGTISGLPKLSDLPSLSVLNNDRLSSGTGMAHRRSERKIVDNSGDDQQVGAAMTDGIDPYSADVGVKVEANHPKNGPMPPIPTLTTNPNIAFSPNKTYKSTKPSFSEVRDLVRNHVPRHPSSTQHRTSIAHVSATAVDPSGGRIKTANDHQSSITRSKQQLSSVTGSQLQVAADRGDPKTLPASEHASHVARGNGVDVVIEELKKIEWSLPVRHRRDGNEDTGRAYFMLVIGNAKSAADAETLIRAKGLEGHAAMQSFLAGEFERSIAAIRRLLLALPLGGSVGKTLAHRPEAIHLLPFIETGEGSKAFETLYEVVAQKRAGGVNSLKKPGRGVGWEGL